MSAYCPEAGDIPRPASTAGLCATIARTERLLAWRFTDEGTDVVIEDIIPLAEEAVRKAGRPVEDAS